MSKTIYFSFFLLFQYFTIYSQSQYKIDTFTNQYDTLTDYNSLVYETFLNGELPLYFDREFELGFEMPYWDISIDRVSISNNQIGYIGGSEEYNMMLFQGEWEIYAPEKLSTDTSFYSDYRYKNGIMDGKKYFVIEYRHVSHNNFILKRPQDEQGDFNFQSWFWDNGDIEIRFGKVQTTDTTIFKDDFGLITGYNPPGSGLIGLDNFEGTEGIYYSGIYNNPKIFNSPLLSNNDIIGLTKLPHEGFVIRFKKQTSGTKEPKTLIPIPNIVTSELNIPEEIIFTKYTICSLNGSIIQSGAEHNISTEYLSQGIFFLKLTQSEVTKTHKFLKL